MSNFKVWLRKGNLFIWISASFVSIALLMILGLIGLITTEGLGSLWPSKIAELTLTNGERVAGMIVKYEGLSTNASSKVQVKVGNRDLYGQDFRYIETDTISSIDYPQTLYLIEREEYGIFIGSPTLLLKDGIQLPLSEAYIPSSTTRSSIRGLKNELAELENETLSKISIKLSKLRRNTNSVSQAEIKILENQFAANTARMGQIRQMLAQYQIELSTIDGIKKNLPMSQFLEIYSVNAYSSFDKVKLFIHRLWNFVFDTPRESNTEGGVFPAIFGTILMVLTMSALVVPLGVIAAIYLREYAKDNAWTRSVRIAVNNLAGVPSIVFGIFGLGFFVYGVGGAIDRIMYPDQLPTPTFGTGGILWASVTLALLTVPVVIVATEEAIASIPRSQREASLALGSTRWQTITKIVLPGAMPGILTGFILAMARGAGEVAPLMVTGVVKLAPTLPLDSQWPFFHFERKFMHLGFHIYDVGFQSPNSEAAKPMVFMTAFLLIVIVLALNLAALVIRNKIRKKLGGSVF